MLFSSDIGQGLFLSFLSGALLNSDGHFIDTLKRTLRLSRLAIDDPADEELIVRVIPVS